MTIDEKRKEIIEEYHCYDLHGESCIDCEECRDNLKKDLKEFENLIRADAIDELKSKKAEIIMWMIKRDKDGYGTTNGELLDHIFEVAEQLKEQI